MKVHKPNSAILAFIQASQATAPKDYYSVQEWAVIMGKSQGIARYWLNGATRRKEADRIEARGTDGKGRTVTMYYYKVHGYQHK